MALNTKSHVEYDDCSGYAYMKRSRVVSSIIVYWYNLAPSDPV